MAFKYFPTLSELRTSLKFRSKEYLRENSLHGFPYFMDPAKSTYSRVGWFIIVLASLGAAITTIITIWDKFQTSPTMMGLGVMPDSVQIYYPNIYLCLNWNSFQVSNNSNLDPDEEIRFKELYEWDWERKIELGRNEDGYAAVFYDLAPNCSDLLSNCSYITKGSHLFEKVVTPAGVCCKFTGKRMKITESANTLHFETRNFPIRLYMTDENSDSVAVFDEPTLELINGSLIKFNPIVTSTTKGISLLSLNQRQCTLDDESTSYSECERRCLINQMKSVCSCLPWFLAVSPTEECPPRQYRCLISARKKWSILNCNCYLPCDHTCYNLEKIERNWHSVQTNVTLNQWPNLIYNREITFGFVDLAVSFGGIAGFFLGYSVLTTFELFYYFTLRTYCGAVLSAPKKGINIVVKPAPKMLMKKEAANSPTLKKDVNFFHHEFVN